MSDDYTHQVRENDRGSFTPLFSVWLILSTRTHWRHTELPTVSLRWRRRSGGDWEDGVGETLPPPLVVIINQHWLRLKFPRLIRLPTGPRWRISPAVQVGNGDERAGRARLCWRAVAEREHVKKKKYINIKCRLKVNNRKDYPQTAGFLG